MCASACRKEAAPGSGHHGGAADHNDRGRLLYHGILSGGNTPVTSCLEKSIKNKKTGRVPAWKLFLFFTLYSVSFSGISHTRSKDIRSARSWNGNHLLPIGRFRYKGSGRALKGPVFWLFPFQSYFSPKCVPPFPDFNRWYRCLRSAARPCCRTVRQEDC